MSDHPSDAIISATAPAHVTAEGDAVNMIDAIIDGVANSSGTVRNKRARSLGSIDNDKSECTTIVLKKPRGRPSKTAVLKSDKLHGKKPKEVGSMSGCSNIAAISATMSDNISNPSCTAIKPSGGKSSSAVSVTPIDYERIDKIVSERVAAELSAKLLPLTLVINTMQKELQSMKETMATFSSVISKLSNSSLAATLETTNTAQQDHQPRQHDSSESSIHKPTYAAAAASEHGISQPPQHYRSQHNTASNSRKQYEPQQRATQEAVTAMYVDQKRKQQRSNNIVISGLQASENDVMTVTELLRSEFEWDEAEWPGISVSKCRRLGKPHDNKNQLLLVTLDSNDQANYYIKNARTLRQSNEKAIR